MDLPKLNLVSGFITDVIPHLNCYEVLTDGRKRIATALTPSSSARATYGPHDLTAYLPGTSVILAVYADETMPYAIILGASPSATNNPEGTIPGAIGHAPVGQHHDQINSLTLQSPNGEGWGYFNFSTGRPWDTLAGDAGWMSSLGGGVALSRTAAFLRASEICGIWAFYFDNLLRVHGHRYEFFTAGGEHHRGDDEGELYEIESRAKYPWEAAGLLKHGTPAFDDNDDPIDQTDTEAAGMLKLRHQDQIGLWRHQTLRGYAGDVEREYIAIPHPDYESTPARQSDSKPRYAGVFEMAKHADGFFSIRSAKGIVLAKTSLIPVPQQMQAPESPAGDRADNYAASGELGTMTGVPQPPEQFDWGTDEYGVRGAGMLEYLAYQFNWKGVANVAQHKLDWKLPEEADLAAITKSTRVTIDPAKLQALRSKFVADKPTEQQVDVDAQNKKTKLLESFSALSILDDGSVILEDAWGSQIIMSRGNIEFAAAGNVMFRPGKSLISWAPGDTILRSGRHVEITSTKHDIRLKAEKNLHVLGGNGGLGGVLVESRSTGSNFQDGQGEDMNTSGIVLLSKKSAVSTWGSEVYVGIHRQSTGSGKIVIDAKEGDGTIYLTSKNEYHRVNGPIVFNYADKGLTDIFHAGNTTINGNVFLLGRTFVLSGQAGDGDIFVQGKCMAGGTVHGNGDDGQVMVYPSGDLEGDLSSAASKIEQSSTLYDATIQAEDDRVHQGDSALGAEALHRRVGFSLRTDAQYKNLYDGLKLGQARWQQYLSTGQTWTETPVEAPTGGDTYPHPGKDVWTGNNFIKVVESNFNTQTGLSVARGDGSDYKNELETEEVSFDGQYPVAVSI